jgi:hypothetical protein
MHRLALPTYHKNGDDKREVPFCNIKGLYIWTSLAKQQCTHSTTLTAGGSTKVIRGGFKEKGQGKYAYYLTVLG